MDAKDAVQPGTQRAWEAAQKHGIPTIFFVNKLDEENASFDTAYAALRDAFGKAVIPFEVPIMENGKTIGSINILRDKAWYFEGPLADPEKAQPVPDDMKDIVAEYKNQIAEAIAMSDDESVSYTHLDVYKRQILRWLLLQVMKSAQNLM